MQQVTLRVGGMTCPGCARSVKRVLEAVAGVESAAVSLERGEALVQFDSERANAGELAGAVQAAGYSAQVA
jgi:copper chaperone